VPFTVIFYCGFDGVLGEDGAVYFNWGEGEVFCDI
jgi:hypothetical protein